jgi:hypothetical protein
MTSPEAMCPDNALIQRRSVSYLTGGADKTNAPHIVFEKA